tara:strand:- start:2409 stop:3530 length:1122 start_codon:yes stop_codon:yes gene_type:complete
MSLSCLKFIKIKKTCYTRPFSPRLENTIFAMSKSELLQFSKNEDIRILEYIESLSDSDTLLNAYKNLSDSNLSIGRRYLIKAWFERHGALFYSLSILKNFYWIKYIGKGSFSTVHLLQDSNSHEENVKVIKISPNVKLKSENITRFYREIEILKAIKHPNIITLFEYGIDCDYSWYLTDYSNLGSVDNYLVAVKSNSVCNTSYFRYQMIRNIISALHFIHKMNIIHRDVKSANIFVSGESYDDENVVFKLGDFNLSRFLENDNSSKLSYCGTRQFMAPEIINGDIYTNKVDMWSFLCVIIHITILKTMNPIIISTDALCGMLEKELSEIELHIVKMLHHVNHIDRANSNEMKVFIEDNFTEYISEKRQRVKSF